MLAELQRPDVIGRSDSSALLSSSPRWDNPEAYLAAMKQMGGTPDDFIAVEDSKRGAMAARTAGIATVLINSSLLNANGWPATLKTICESLEECCLILMS